MAGLLHLVLAVLLAMPGAPVPPVPAAATVEPAAASEVPPRVAQPGEIDWNAGIELDVEVRTTRLDAEGELAIF